MRGEPCGQLKDDSASDGHVDGVGIGWVLGMCQVAVVVGPVEKAGALGLGGHWYGIIDVDLYMNLFLLSTY
jgi:hypothetical protein